MAVPILDISTYSASLALIGGYQLYLRFRLRRDRTYTIQSINATARSAWVENIMADKSLGVLGVQTLRNSTMAATFLASTAILMSMGVLNLMQNSGRAGGVLKTLHGGLINSGDFEKLKLMILLATFISTFFCFSMAVRMYNHVGYLINSRNTTMPFSPSTSYVSNLLNRSGKYYSYGMRAYYISVPMIFSLLSPYYMLVASIVLVVFLYKIDRAPKILISAESAKKEKLVKASLAPLAGKKEPEAAALQKTDEKDTTASSFDLINGRDASLSV